MSAPASADRSADRADPADDFDLDDPAEGRPSSIPARYLAGWLFADLFLVLFVLVLGLDTPKPEHPPPVGPTRPPATAGDAPGRVLVGGIDPEYQGVPVRLSPNATALAQERGALTRPDAAKVIRAVREEVALSGEGRKIGMLITFGGAPQFQENARTLARHTNAALLSGAPDLFCAGNVGDRPFWDGDPLDNREKSPLDAVRVDVYYANSCDAAAPSASPGAGGPR
ncbi:hypothetical protein [Streptomyces sp. NPDC060194]|uniref:hypothetical protein n=1 Tax=Streptomyces sp. NPDC060194 TaxID=3347069 RepID=UPI00365DE9E0